MRVESGALVDARAAAGAEGTRIEVAELFGNVPARRKFLKSATTEWGHIGDWLARAALALPRIHFDVRRDAKNAFSWPSVENPLDRIAAVLSERDAAALVAAERVQGDAALHAYVSRPDAHRATTAGIHLFVNGRPVRDRLMRHALLQVYRDLLPRGRFPTAVLFLSVPTSAVDVNVHPAKWEVRFDDPQAIHRMVTATVSEAIGSRGWLGEASYPPSQRKAGWAAGSDSRARGERLDLRRAGRRRSGIPAAIGVPGRAGRRGRQAGLAALSPGGPAPRRPAPRHLSPAGGESRDCCWWTSTRPTSGSSTNGSARPGSRAEWNVRVCWFPRRSSWRPRLSPRWTSTER